VFDGDEYAVILILDRLLADRGLSVADLSRMTGMGRSTIDDIRRRQGGRRENMDRIAAALNLRYEDLFEAPKPPANNDTSESTPESPPLRNAPAKRLLHNLTLGPEEALLDDLQWLSGKLNNTDPVTPLKMADALCTQGDFENATLHYKAALLDAWRISPAQLECSVANFLMPYSIQHRWTHKKERSAYFRKAFKTRKKSEGLDLEHSVSLSKPTAQNPTWFACSFRNYLRYHSCWEYSFSSS